MKLIMNDYIMKKFLYQNSEFLANSPLNRILAKVGCRLFPNLICKNLIYLFFGFNAKQINSTRLQVYYNHIPASTSTSNIAHLALNRRNQRVELLDYIYETQNIECYNSVKPPLIPLENIKMEDLYLFNSLNDIFSTPEDVEKLKKTLRGN